MYSKIVNPKTGRKVSVTSRLGKSIVRKYLNVLTGGTQRVHQVPPRALGPVAPIVVAPTSAPPAPYNGGNIPWYYTGERQLLRDGWSMTTLGAGVRVSGTPAYYFKTHPNPYSISTTNIYWGPLYYHNDGTYRSNNSREAAMMKQQYMAMKFPGASWNQEAATLPKAPAIPTEHPRELQHQLILIKPLQALQTGAAIAPHNHAVSSSALPQRGEVLGFKWSNPDGTGSPSSSSSLVGGVVYPITKDQWINEQLNLPNTDRHYSLAPRQRELAKQKLKIKRGLTGRREATRMVAHVKDLPVNDDVLGQVLGYLSSSAVADSTQRQYIKRRTRRDAALRAAAEEESASAAESPAEEVQEVSYENLARGPIPKDIMDRYGLREYDY